MENDTPGKKWTKGSKCNHTDIRQDRFQAIKGSKGQKLPIYRNKVNDLSRRHCRD